VTLSYAALPKGVAPFSFIELREVADHMELNEMEDEARQGMLDGFN